MAQADARPQARRRPRGYVRRRIAMTLDEAAETLAREYGAAKRGEMVLSIHLFGIKYADEIGGLSVPGIVRKSGLSDTYVTEVHKGIKLAKHVRLR